jgi:hypothetical protein
MPLTDAEGCAAAQKIRDKIVGQSAAKTKTECVSSCLACPAGKFAAGVGSVSCTLCAEGQHQSAVGQISCRDCRVGTLANLDHTTCFGIIGLTPDTQDDVARKNPGLTNFSAQANMNQLGRPTAVRITAQFTGFGSFDNNPEQKTRFRPTTMSPTAAALPAPTGRMSGAVLEMYICICFWLVIDVSNLWVDIAPHHPTNQPTNQPTKQPSNQPSGLTKQRV